jgi:hypothetical protein
MKDTAIIRDRAMLAKKALPLSIHLIGITDLGNHSQDSLGRQRELILDAEVESLLNRVLVEGTVLPGPIADKVGSVIGTLKCLQQRGCLLRGRLELDLSGQLHNKSIS